MARVTVRQATVARIVRVFLDTKGNLIHMAHLTFRSDRFGIERDTTDMIEGS